MSDVRRCRRCKRKRLDDEPPEVRLYKTCAKCRIIERQKKKSRKPLAEEAMTYGMRQFHKQPHNSNFTHDDAFSDYDVFDQKSKAPDAPKPSQQQYSLYKFQASQPQLPSQRIQIPTSISADLNAPVGLAHQQEIQHTSQSHYGATRSINLSTPTPTPAVAMAVSAASRKAPVEKCNCEICNEGLDMEDELSATYKLCSDCYTNPFRLPGVYANYNNYISAIQKNRFSDIKNFVFIKTTDKDFATALDLLHPRVGNEKQFRELLFGSLRTIYLEPILASMNTKFSHVSSNVNEINSMSYTGNFSDTAPIKAIFKCSRDAEFGCGSNLYLNFNVRSKLLIVKLNHLTHRISRNYSRRFVEIIEATLQKLKDSGKKNVDFNVSTAYLVLNALQSDIANYSPDIQSLIKFIKQHKHDYVNDFIHFEKVIQKSHSQALSGRSVSIQDIATKSYGDANDSTVAPGEEAHRDDSANDSDGGSEITDSSTHEDSSEDEDEDDTARPSSRGSSSAHQGFSDLSAASPHSSLKILTSAENRESAGENFDPTLKP